MRDLTPESRALLKGARKDFEASAGERARVGRALARRIGVAAGTIAATSVSTSASAAGVAGSVTTGASVGPIMGPIVGTGAAASALVAGAKWAGAVLLVGALGAGGVSVYRAERSAATSTPAVTFAPPPHAAPSTSFVPPPKAATPVPVAPAAPTGTAVMPPSGAKPSLEAEAAGQRGRPLSRESLSAGTVAQETRLLRLADEAMRSGDATHALELLDEHARVFPRGILAEERSAERVSTLCTLGRPAEAREEAALFLRATPDSPLAGSVRSSCGSPDR